MSAHHGHSHSPQTELGDQRVLWALGVNLTLTAAQVIGGIFAGSLSLIADAIHNFSDAISLGIAYLARRIARRPSDETMTFGYVRAELIAALINYTTLIVLGLYLIYETFVRFFDPHQVAGWPIVIIAGIALVVDLITALLTYALSKESMNIRAAFLHNVADALGSVGVIIAGTLIIVYDWHFVDPLVTLMIAAYILWHALSEIGGSIRLLMLGAPPEINLPKLIAAVSEIEGVANIHHLHVWSIDEHQKALEAHVVVTDGSSAACQEIKHRIKSVALEQFGISHTTLELEGNASCCEGKDAQVIGHHLTDQRSHQERTK